MLIKRWKIKPHGSPETANRLQEELKINSILAHLLSQRGISNYEEAKRFFRPSLSDLHDPFLMKDMDKAVARIEKAVSSGEKILVYGDYDVDGTTAVALVYSFLKNQTPSNSPKGGEFTGRDIPFYHTTDKQMWKLLHEKAVAMRNNPTQAENVLWQILRKHGTDYHFRRQHLIGRFIVDFVCLEKSLVVEVDGDIHDYQQKEDEERTSFLNRNGFTVIRFRNEEVIGNIDNVGGEILEKLQSFPSNKNSHAQSLSPLGRDGVGCDFYIPDRYKEGYGISSAGIDFAAENNFSLIIALDCGIKSADKIRYAKEKGIDFIICDHHLPGDELPDAVAALDPQRSDCPYPYKELSGCGIGFKLVQALSHSSFVIRHSSLEEYLDLVAISIASDIVPITGENRILTYFGLQKLNTSPRKGIRALLEVSGLKKEIGVNEIVFGIGPRINAAGRMESGRKAVELFLSSTAEEADYGGKELNRNNTSRKEIDTDTTREALQRISENPVLRQRKSTVLFDPSWHKGVIGIVASRLMETYYRPTVLLTQSDGMVCGSARSVKNFDLYEAISRCSDLLEQFGGHKFAAGLTLKPENVEAFSERFEQVVTSMITDEMLIPEIEIDAVINFSDITPSFCRIIKQFAPFGPGNLSPVFLTENVCDNGSARIVGKNHLKMELFQMTSPLTPLSKWRGDGGEVFPAIGFGMEEYYGIVSVKKPFSACYNIDEREYNGKKYLQLLVKDIHPANYELSR